MDVLKSNHHIKLWLLIKFQTNNVFGPANAAHELMKLNGKDGNTPGVVTVFIRSDGAVAYEFE